MFFVSLTASSCAVPKSIAEYFMKEIMVPRFIIIIAPVTSQFAPDTIKYFEILPLKRGAPVIQNTAITVTAPIKGLRLKTPRILFISLVP